MRPPNGFPNQFPGGNADADGSWLPLGGCKAFPETVPLSNFNPTWQQIIGPLRACHFEEQGTCPREQSQREKKTTVLFFSANTSKGRDQGPEKSGPSRHIKLLGFGQVPNLLNLACMVIPNISREALIKTNKTGVLYIFTFPSSQLFSAGLHSKHFLSGE